MTKLIEKDEKTVAEIVERMFKGTFNQPENEPYLVNVPTRLAKKELTQTLQTERQKREEVVEKEKKRTRLAESYIIGEHIDEYYTKAEAFTQPNNPK